MRQLIFTLFLVCLTQTGLASDLRSTTVAEIGGREISIRESRFRIAYDQEAIGPSFEVTLARSRLTLSIANYFEIPVAEAPVFYSDAAALRDDLLTGLEYDDPGERSFFLSYIVSW